MLSENNPASPWVGGSREASIRYGKSILNGDTFWKEHFRIKQEIHKIETLTPNTTPQTEYEQLRRGQREFLQKQEDEKIKQEEESDRRERAREDAKENAKNMSYRKPLFSFPDILKNIDD